MTDWLIARPLHAFVLRDLGTSFLRIGIDSSFDPGVLVAALMNPPGNVPNNQTHDQEINCFYEEVEGLYGTIKIIISDCEANNHGTAPSKRTPDHEPRFSLRPFYFRNMLSRRQLQGFVKRAAKWNFNAKT